MAVGLSRIIGNTHHLLWTHIDFDEYSLISDYGMDRSTLTELLEAGEFLIEFRRMLAENGEDY